MIRSIVGVVGGIVLAGAVIVLGEAVSHLAIPPPGGLDPRDAASIKGAMAHVSAGSLVAVLGSWAIGTFVGAGLAASLARRARVACALAVGGAVTAAAILDMLSIPHPAWFWVASFAVVVPTSWLAGRLATPPMR